VYDQYNTIPDPTRRDIHQKTERAGQMGNGEYNKHYVYDQINAVPDPTRRDIHQKTERAGFVGNGEYNKYYVYDQINAIPDPTRRDIHQKTERAGSIGNAQYDKPLAFDFVNGIPDPTMRDIHQKTDRAGFVGNAQFDKPLAFDFINGIPDPTMRDIHNNNRPGIIGSNEKEKQMSRKDANNMMVNISKEKISKGRAPTRAGYEKGPSMDYTIVRFCDPIQINRDLYPDNKEMTSDKLPMIYGKLEKPSQADDWRFYSYVKENLEKNPYINNMVHKSIENDDDIIDASLSCSSKSLI
jgi:hypothetical protein